MKEIPLPLRDRVQGMRDKDRQQRMKEKGKGTRKREESICLGGGQRNDSG